MCACGFLFPTKLQITQKTIETAKCLQTEADIELTLSASPAMAVGQLMLTLVKFGLNTVTFIPNPTKDTNCWNFSGWKSHFCQVSSKKVSILNCLIRKSTFSQGRVQFRLSLVSRFYFFLTQHKETDVLHQECDETKENAGGDSDDRVGPQRKDPLLKADQVNHYRPKDETSQEHDGFEAPGNMRKAK